MPTFDQNALAIFAIGVAVYFGAFQMNACHQTVPYFIAAGYGVGVLGLIYIWPDSWVVRIVFMIGIIIGAVITWDVGKQTYWTANIKSYISLEERNRQNWDTIPGDTESSIPLPDDGQRRLSQKPGIVKFTPVVRTMHDTIEEGTEITFTITVGNAVVKWFTIENKNRGWEPVKGLAYGFKFRAKVDEKIRPARRAKGPYNSLEVELPAGDYTVEWVIEGNSTRGCAFDIGGQFPVHIHP